MTRRPTIVARNGVATPFVVGLSDDPETWLEPRVASAEDAMPTP